MAQKAYDKKCKELLNAVQVHEKAAKKAVVDLNNLLEDKINFLTAHGEVREAAAKAKEVRKEMDDLTKEIEDCNRKENKRLVGMRRVEEATKEAIRVLEGAVVVTTKEEVAKEKEKEKEEEIKEEEEDMRNDDDRDLDEHRKDLMDEVTKKVKEYHLKDTQHKPPVDDVMRFNSEFGNRYISPQQRAGNDCAWSIWNQLVKKLDTDRRGRAMFSAKAGMFRVYDEDVAVRQAAKPLPMEARDMVGTLVGTPNQCYICSAVTDQDFRLYLINDDDIYKVRYDVIVKEKAGRDLWFAARGRATQRQIQFRIGCFNCVMKKTVVGAKGNHFKLFNGKTVPFKRT